MTARVPWSRLWPPAAFAAAFAVLAWIVLARHGTPYGVDKGPHDWAVAHRPHAAATAARWVTDAGTGVVPPLAAALGGWLAGLAAYHGGEVRAARAGRLTPLDRRALPLALLSLVTLLLGQAVRTGLMTLLGRARPPVADWAVRAGGHSFPSGHTTSSAMAAGLLAWGLLRLRPGRTGRVLAALCCLAAAAVGCSRVYLGVHWPTDVLGGWLLAGFWLTATLPLLSYVAGGRGTRGRPAEAEQGEHTEDAEDAGDAGGAGQTDTP